MKDSEVGLRLHPDSVFRYDSNLELIGTLVCLEVLGEGTTVGATNQNKIKVSFIGTESRLLWTTTTCEATLAGLYERSIAHL
jgi:hypothetical protein